jgi:uncharacterized membrane protein
MILYPVLVYFGLSYFDASAIALMLLLLAAARLVLVGRDRRLSPAFPALLLSLMAILFIGALVLISGSADHLRLYPVCVNGLMLILFGASLLKPPSIVERMARIWDPDLPDSAVRYTRRVTEVWCAFFVLNGSAALLTAVAADMELWAFYNGVVSYVLMGFLFAGEYLVRRRVLRRKALATGAP